MHWVRATHFRAVPDERALHRATVACATALQLSFREAALLVRAAPVTLPRLLPSGAAEALAGTLRAAGLEAELRPGADAPCCPAHQALHADGACERCGRVACALCRAQPPGGLCPRCLRRGQLRRGFYHVRVALLLCVLAGVALWGLGVHRGRAARTDWTHTVDVDVVLLLGGPVPDPTLQTLRERVPLLEDLLRGEFARRSPRSLARPFSLLVLGPVLVRAPPPDPTKAQGLVASGQAHYDLWRYLREVGWRGALRFRPGALRMYVHLQPVKGRVRSVEGLGAAGGDVGVVYAEIDEGTVDQALLALGHELLHCLGATDKYDEAGHAREPDGLADPGQVPRYPQRYAEIMVGEVPLGPGQGRLVETLAEVQVGPRTAEEIGWLR